METLDCMVCCLKANFSLSIESKATLNEWQNIGRDWNFGETFKGNVNMMMSKFIAMRHPLSEELVFWE